MNSKDVILSEISQSQKNKYSMNPLNEVCRVVRLIESESRMMGARGLREARMGSAQSLSLG